MRRRLFTLASAVSLLLFAATVVLWVRSYFAWYRYESDRGATAPDRPSIGMTDGKLYLNRLWVDSKTTIIGFRNPRGFTVAAPVHSAASISVQGSDYSFAGFSKTRTDIAGIHILDLRLPLWAIAMPLLVLPILELVRRRSRSGCMVCSYNLTGNSSGVCPECGTAIQQKR